MSDLKNSESYIIKNMKNLPKGGLKGLIYYKLGYLNEEGIKVILSINENIRKMPYMKIKPDLNKDILKIIGVYLDNAVEAAVESKQKEISLEMFYEKGIFTFILSNTYSGKITIDPLERKYKSHKGKNRGYGLLLVDKIMKNNKNISRHTEVVNNFYIQYLYVDFKNISI